jgi:hypothetical protein
VNELRQRSVVKRALACLASQHIDAVLLKGAALAATAYPQPHLRPMSDIDVWVPVERLPEAVRCLLDAGFEAPAGSADGRLSPMLSQHRLRDPASSVRVELHGEIHSLECLSPERVQSFWRRSEPLVVGDVATRMLHPEDALMHTCLHLVTNGFAGGQLGLFDARMIIEKWPGRIDWMALAETARREGSVVSLTLSLTVARRVWMAAVPDLYFSSVGDIEALDELEELAVEQVWETDLAVPPALERALREPNRSAGLAVLAHRLVVEPWQSRPDERRRAWSIAAGAAQRWLDDLTIKLPRYVRAWRTGALSGADFQRRARLAARRGRIGTLVSQAETDLRRTGK